MVNFNLKEFAKFRKCDLNLLKNWLCLNGINRPFNGKVLLEAQEYQKILMIADIGIRNEFTSASEHEIKEIQRQLKVLNGMLVSILAMIKKENKKKRREQLEKRKQECVSSLNILNFKASILGVRVDHEQNIKTIFLKPISITIEWSDITFKDGFIIVKHLGKFFDRFSVQNAKEYLNAIKSHYKFRNAPKLILELNHNKIIKIENIDVLFYYIQFLTNAGSQFHKHIIQSIPVIGKYKIHTKAYYKKHLPNLFQSDCFKYLCEFADNDLPIIPVPEIVINSNGVTQIDDSFLFPLVNRKTIYWLWESVEESKATYLFQTLAVDLESQLQIVYDYLTGDTVNKRETLIRSLKLKKHLCLKTRVMHTDFNNWKNEVRIYSKE